MFEPPCVSLCVPLCVCLSISLYVCLCTKCPPPVSGLIPVLCVCQCVFVLLSLVCPGVSISDTLSPHIFFPY